LRSIPISKDLETLDLNTEEGKNNKMIVELNELAFVEFMLLIDTSTNPGEVAFQLVKICKTVGHGNRIQCLPGSSCLTSLLQG